MESSQTSSRSSSPPSSPLSFLSQSPSPPSPVELDAAKRYPSPITSSAPSGSVSPMKLTDMIEGIRETADGPPAKRRKITTPRTPRKPRRTELIDLENLDDTQAEELERLKAALRKKKRIVVIAGAGISVSAGIPDFRSATGLFATGRSQYNVKASGKHLFDASVYKHDSSTSSFHNMVRELAQMTSVAKPTPFHEMLATIANEGRLLRLYSQNVDCIDTKMVPLKTEVPLPTKGPWPQTVQLHGGLGHMVCSKCSSLKPFEPLLFEGPEAPLCQQCKEHDEVRTCHAGKRSHGIGRLRPRIVLYNEYNPDEDAIGMVSKADLRRVPDAVIVVGTSLKIPGVRRLVKEFCQVTRSRRDGLTAWINTDAEPQGNEFKDCWDFVVRGRCDDVATEVGLPRFDQQDIGDEKDYMVSGDEDKEKRRIKSLSRDRIDIVVEQRSSPSSAATTDDESASNSSPLVQKSRLVEDDQAGIPTPSASPKMPKMRNPLPPGKNLNQPPPGKKIIRMPEAIKEKVRQTKLAFGTVGAPSSAPAKTKPAAVKATAAKVTKTTKKRKEPAPVSRSITNAFKATKTAASFAKAAGKKPQSDSKENVPWTKALPAQDTIFPNLPAKVDGLPSLRPLVPAKRSLPYVITKRELVNEHELPRSPVSSTSALSPSLLPALAQRDGSPMDQKLPFFVPQQRPRNVSDPISELTVLSQTPPQSSSPDHSSTPNRLLAGPSTISPASRPRNMAHLID